MAVASRIANASPVGLDRLGVDAIVLPFFEVRAQPRGVAGAVDWRLCGRLARLLRSEVFSGRLGEHALMPAMGRFGAARIFLVGLGDPSASTGPSVVDHLARAATMLFDADAKELAVAPPTPSTAGDLTAAKWWLEAVGKSGHSFTSVVLLDSDGALAAGRDELVTFAKKCQIALAVS